MADDNYVDLINKRLAASDLDLSDRITAVRLLDDATVYRHGVDTTNRLACTATVYFIAAEWSQINVGGAEAEFMIDCTIDLITEQVRERQQEKAEQAKELARETKALEADHGLEL